MLLDFIIFTFGENEIYETPYYVILSALFLLAISGFKSVSLIME